MSNNNPQNEGPFDTLKNESARQRWQLFHRAIAHAKQSNMEALQEADMPRNPEVDQESTAVSTRAPSLSIAR